MEGDLKLASVVQNGKGDTVAALIPSKDFANQLFLCYTRIPDVNGLSFRDCLDWLLSSMPFVAMAFRW
jgi:hypothetical protein